MDVILVGFVAGLTWAGWRTGFVRRLAGLAFIAISFVAGRLSPGSVRRARQPTSSRTCPPAYAGLLAYAFLFPVVLVVLHVVSQPFLKRIKVGNMTQRAGQGARRDLRLHRGRTHPVGRGRHLRHLLRHQASARQHPGLSASSASSLRSTSRTRSTAACDDRALVLTSWDRCCPRTSRRSCPAACPACPAFPASRVRPRTRPSSRRIPGVAHAQALTRRATSAQSVHHRQR